MKLLVACEESQRVCTAFREKGHEAYRCDIIECSGGHPEWHIKADVLPLLNGNCKFITMDGTEHEINGKWDMIIAHPPCTYLTVSGNRWFDIEKYGEKAKERHRLREEAIAFFMHFVYADCDRIAVENPVGVMSIVYRKPDCIYNPYDFENETECKKTCLWLKGLPTLKATRLIPLTKEERTTFLHKAYFDGKYFRYNSRETAIIRSKTPIGVAKAMAEQWG